LPPSWLENGFLLFFELYYLLGKSPRITLAFSFSFMNTCFDFIVWDASPELFGFLRWYGLLFAGGFLISYILLKRIYKIEGKNEDDLDKLTFYMVISTVIGARLGHCLFYEPDYYLANPIEILKIWKGGLASHGAAVAILVALWLYSKKNPSQPYLWILDRVVIMVALASSFIRLGNLMNSEIVGAPTDVAWGFIFVQNGEDFARHPTQIYESITYLLSFLILYRIWLKYKADLPAGRVFGLFLILIFGMRFVWEFMKENQVEFEQNFVLNMGQMLSIPLILAGIFFLLRSFRATDSKEQPNQP